MPVITINIGKLETREAKAELVTALTAAASSATKIPENKFIVLINEMERDNIGVSGKLLSDVMK